MGIKQENEITMKVNCGISELCGILELFAAKYKKYLTNI